MVAYTANASSLGTAVGDIQGARINVQATGALVTPDRVTFDFSNRNDKAIVLRGTSDILAITSNNTAWPTGTTLSVNVEFTEE